MKGGYVVVSPSGYVTIDNNELIKQKLEEIKAKQIEMVEAGDEEEVDGFVEGLDSLQVARLVGEADEEDESPIIRPVDIEKMTEEANAEAERIVSEAKQEAASIQESARSEGFEAGYSEGKAKADSEVASIRRSLEEEYARKAEELEAEYNKLKEELEPALVDKLADIYEKIVGIELTDSKETVTFLLKKALGSMDSNKSYIIHVSQEDFADVNASIDDILKSSGILADNLEVIEDHSLSKNGCMIESDGGIFEVGLDTQMTLLSKQLKILSMQPS